MEFFESVDCDEWFEKHGSLANNVEAGVNFYGIYSVARERVGEHWWKILKIVGETETMGRLEPIYRVEIRPGVSVLIWFMDGGVEFSVTSRELLRNLRSDLFDHQTASWVGSIMFSANSYSQSRLDFSGRLPSSKLLADFWRELCTTG